MPTSHQPFPAAALNKLLAQVGKHRILVLMGGMSPERRISLLTGQAVLRALQGLHLPVQSLDIKRPQDLAGLFRRPPQVAFLCLHGPGGEDGSIQGLLEWLQIPYTGSGVLASALGMDKHRSKLIFRDAGLPTAPWQLLSAATGWQGNGRLHFPLVVKPNRQGSAIGVMIVKQPEHLAAAIKRARRFSSEVLLEKFCSGKEISVSILKQQALAVIEIVPKRAFYDYQAKYTPGMSEHILPARLPARQYAQAQKLALAAHQALGCQGLSRVDMIAGMQGELNLLEVNTMPGLTATSLFPDAARFAGISFEALILTLIQDALGKKI